MKYVLSLILRDETDEDAASVPSPHDGRIINAIAEGYASGPATPMTKDDWTALRDQVTRKLNNDG